jgi:hypothetical protein
MEEDCEGYATGPDSPKPAYIVLIVAKTDSKTRSRFQVGPPRVHALLVVEDHLVENSKF